MHLAIFLFPILLISVSSVEFREDIPPYVLDGFKHIKAKAIVEGVVPSVKDASLYVTPQKHYHMCSNFYCHSQGYDHCDDRVFNTMCDMYCGYFVEHADKELMDKQIKNLNSTEPAGSTYECIDKPKPSLRTMKALAHLSSLSSVSVQQKERLSSWQMSSLAPNTDIDNKLTAALASEANIQERADAYEDKIRDLAAKLEEVRKSEPSEETNRHREGQLEEKVHTLAASLEEAKQKASQREDSYEETIRAQAVSLKEAETRAEFAERSVEKLQKEVYALKYQLEHGKDT